MLSAVIGLLGAGSGAALAAEPAKPKEAPKKDDVKKDGKKSK